MSDLSSLIARLEKAEGPSYSLEVEVAHITGFWPEERVEKITRADDGLVTVWFTEGPDMPLPPAVTSSIDAAVSLAERVLPGLSKIQPETYVGGEFHHCEVETEEGDFEAHNCPNVAIAICLATLRALQQKGSSNG